MSTTYIIGHKHPDTDSVVAAMALEYYYQQRPNPNFPHPQAAIIDPINAETIYLFDKFHATAPELITNTDLKKDDQVILVDHNEESQRLDDLDPEKISQIIDHHKVNINLPQPIEMNFKAWGSTSTIVYSLMQKDGDQALEPSKNLAALMLAAILSDTVGFKSPTTTDHDRTLGKKLAKIAGINDLDGFTLEIFKAKSNLSQLSDLQIIKNDFKIYDFKKKVYIGQIETVEQAELLKQKKTGLLEAMDLVKGGEEVDLIFLAVTDILNINTKLVVLGPEEESIAAKAFAGKVSDQVIDIGAKMSRKKEIAPAIEKALS